MPSRSWPRGCGCTAWCRRSPGPRSRCRGRVDVNVDLFLGEFGFQIEKLGADDGREAVVDRTVQEHHALTKQAREDVEGALARLDCSTTMGTRLRELTKCRSWTRLMDCLLPDIACGGRLQGGRRAAPEPLSTSFSPRVSLPAGRRRRPLGGRGFGDRLLRLRRRLGLGRLGLGRLGLAVLAGALPWPWPS